MGKRKSLSESSATVLLEPLSLALKADLPVLAIWSNPGSKTVNANSQNCKLKMILPNPAS